MSTRGTLGRRVVGLAFVQLFVLQVVHNKSPSVATLNPTRHSCVGEDDHTRICRFANLVVHDNQLLYISDTVKSLPKMAGYMQGYKSQGPEIQILSVAAAEKLLAAAEEVVKAQEGVLVFRMHHENWGHHMLDITATTHRLLCSTLERCSYTPEALENLWLVFTDNFPRHEGNFARIWACYSSNPPLYLKQRKEGAGQLTVLGTVVAGWSPLGLFTSSWDKQSAQSYHDRMWQCVGLKSPASVADVEPPLVTIVQRPHGESHKARSFVNAYDIVPKLKAALPQANFQVATMLDLSFEDMVGVFHNSTVIIAASGAAMGNCVFMRRGSTYIDVGPAQYHYTFVTWIMANLGDVAGVQVINHSVNDPRHAPVRWEVVAAMKTFQQMTKEQIISAIRNHDCPPGALHGHCKADWLYTKTDFVLDAKQITTKVKKGLAYAHKFAV